MPLLEAIRQHRSIRRYRPDPVPEELLEEILQTGLRASSSGNMQAFSVVVTKDPELRRQLYQPHMQQAMVLEAPVLLTFCADFHRMRRWLALSEAPDGFDNFMSFMVAAIDAVLVAQNVALAAEHHQTWYLWWDFRWATPTNIPPYATDYRSTGWYIKTPIRTLRTNKSSRYTENVKPKAGNGT
jgi:nitroreductase